MLGRTAPEAPHRSGDEKAARGDVSQWCPCVGGAEGRASALGRVELNSEGAGQTARAGQCVCCRCTKMHSDAAAVSE